MSEFERLKNCTFVEINNLPESYEVERTGSKVLTIFRQRFSDNEILVTLQLATNKGLGFYSKHVEKGLIFNKNGAAHEASSDELLHSGG